ncbi:MAG: hypothetical protein AB1611_10195 [bacterium]
MSFLKGDNGCSYTRRRRIGERAVMIDIPGIGWITAKEYGCVAQNISRTLPPMKSIHGQLSNEGIFLYPVKYFGRFDAVSKMTCCAIALALHDAGLVYSEDRKQDMGIVGTNERGSLESNISYFQDYVESGRTLARGNLFLYTLSSSPLAEAAIYFGCQGPVLYLGFQRQDISSLLSCAGHMLCSEGVSGMLAVAADEEEAVCFCMQPKEADPMRRGFGFENIKDIVEKTTNINQVIDRARWLSRS